MASNFIEILNQLHDAHVDFVIVGGVAAALHGGSRVTFDIDVIPSLEPDSWRAVVDCYGLWVRVHVFQNLWTGFAMWTRSGGGGRKRPCWH